MSNKHTLGSFDEALDKLRDLVLKMGARTETSLENAMRCLFDRDDGRCNVAIADDDEIDEMEKEVDDLGVNTIARYQPVSEDLRDVIATMKISNDIERVADQAANIAKKGRKLCETDITREADGLRPMFVLAMELFRDSLKAFSESNLEAALSLRKRDKELDSMNAQTVLAMTQKITENPTQAPTYLLLIMIARHLERVGDHAKNIAEDAVYAISAEDIRHLHSRAN